MTLESEITRKMDGTETARNLLTNLCMNFSWYRIAQFVSAVIIPGGLGILFFVAAWRRLRSRMPARVSVYSGQNVNRLSGQAKSRSSSRIGVPEFVGPPYVYVENRRK